MATSFLYEDLVRTCEVDPTRLISPLLLIALLMLMEIAAAEYDAMRVVQASEIIAKVENNEPVDYSYVIVKGDLNLSQPDVSMTRFVTSQIKITDSIINGSIDLENTIIKELVNFRRTKFIGPVIFNSAQFNGGADFERSQFDGYSLFTNSWFEKFANLRYIKFNKNAIFLNAKFEDDSDFSFSQFKGYTNFRSAVFANDAKFEESTFENYTTFTKAQFDNANFIGAQFNESVDFDSVQFNKSVSFVGVGFKKDLYFSDVQFAKLAITLESIKGKLVCNGASFLALIKDFKDKEQFEDADNCYYQYREWKRNDRPLDWDKILDYVSWLSCGYGVRWQHTILSGIMMVTLFGMYFESYCLRRKAANFFHKHEPKNPCKYDLIQNFKKSMSFSVMLLLSLPPEWSHSGRDEFARFVTRHWFSSIFERLIGWGLVLLLIGTLTRLMVRY